MLPNNAYEPLVEIFEKVIDKEESIERLKECAKKFNVTASDFQYAHDIGEEDEIIDTWEGLIEMYNYEISNCIR